jgi:hypothetical protein
VAKAFLARLQHEREPARGVRRDIDDNGDLLVRKAGKVERRSLVAALAAPSWLDPASGGPRK